MKHSPMVTIRISKGLIFLYIHVYGVICLDFAVRLMQMGLTVRLSTELDPLSGDCWIGFPEKG